MEAIWMMAGSDQVDWLLQFNSGFGKFAEPDGTVHGAYGYRWRKRWTIDQVLWVINILKTDPTSRRAVIAMWDPLFDLGAHKADLPCNTHIYFCIRDEMLDMTVCCRSNDILWGAYGANAVHMSVLQELIAFELGVPVGMYHQMSNNYHAYLDLPIVQSFLDNPPEPVEYYQQNRVTEVPLLFKEDIRMFIEDCEDMVHGRKPTRVDFLRCVAEPMRESYLLRKEGVHMPMEDQSIDWFRAYTEWCERRD